MKWLVCLVSVLPSLLWAQSGIRDAEIEHYLASITKPIFQAADIHPESVNLYIVKSDALNAFVAGGQNIYIHTGLLAKSSAPSMLIGVLAHETGHIKGGHLMKLNDEMKRLTAASALGYVLGAASIAAGAPSSVGSAIISGTQHATNRSALKYSRVHEQAADQAALSILQNIGVGAGGLLELMKEFKRQQSIYLRDDVSPYMLTHPVSDSRIEHLTNVMQTAKYRHNFVTKSVREKHARMVAKLRGFLEEPHSILQETKESNAPSDHYMRAIALHRTGKLSAAMAALDKAGETWKKDAYFYELKGQFYFESGDLARAKPMFERALKQMRTPHPIAQLELAITLIGLAEKEKKPAYYDKAARLLERALIKERYNAGIWRQLAIAYGRSDQLGLSYLALAEEAVLKKQKKEANRYLDLAKKHLPEKAPQRLRIKDLSKALK